MRPLIGVGVLAVLACSMRGQNVTKDTHPDTFLPPGNVRTSLPGVIRLYKTIEPGKIGPQPADFPKTISDPTKPFEMAADEMPRIHEGIDYSSRGKDGKPTPLEFRAGVYGTVVEARKGIIVVEVDDRGNRVEFLHNSTVANGIKAGAKVTPLTILGQTGNINPKTGEALAGMGIHLHIQARAKSLTKGEPGPALYPDEVLAYASKPIEQRNQKAIFFVPMKWVDLKPLKPIDWSEMQKDFVDRGLPRIGYDENAPKLRAEIAGTWNGVGTSERGNKYYGKFNFQVNGTYQYSGSFIDEQGKSYQGTDRGTWTRHDDQVQVSPGGNVRPMTFQLTGKRLSTSLSNTPVGRFTLVLEKQ